MVYRSNNYIDIDVDINRLSHTSLLFIYLFVAGLGVGGGVLVHQVVEALVELGGELLGRLGTVVGLLGLSGVGIQLLKTETSMNEERGGVFRIAAVEVCGVTTEHSLTFYRDRHCIARISQL
jgi:hypothetical protein